MARWSGERLLLISPWALTWAPCAHKMRRHVMLLFWMSVRILCVLLPGFAHVVEVTGQCSSIKLSVVRPVVSLEWVLITRYTEFTVGTALREQLMLKKPVFKVRPFNYLKDMFQNLYRWVVSQAIPGFFVGCGGMHHYVMGPSFIFYIYNFFFWKIIFTFIQCCEEGPASWSSLFYLCRPR